MKLSGVFLSLALVLALASGCSSESPNDPSSAVVTANRQKVAPKPRILLIYTGGRIQSDGIGALRAQVANDTKKMVESLRTSRQKPQNYLRNAGFSVTSLALGNQKMDRVVQANPHDYLVVYRDTAAASMITDISKYVGVSLGFEYRAKIRSSGVEKVFASGVGIYTDFSLRLSAREREELPRFFLKIEADKLKDMVEWLKDPPELRADADAARLVEEVRQGTRDEVAFNSEGKSSVPLVAFSRDGLVLAVATDAGLEIWDHQNGKRLRHIPVSGGVHELYTGKTGKQFLVRTGTRYGIADVENGTSKVLRDQESCCEFSFDGSWLGLHDDAGITVIDIATAKEEFRLKPFTGPYLRLFDTSPDDRLIAASDGGDVLIWERAKRRLVKTVPFDRYAGSKAIAFSPDSRWLVVIGTGVGEKSAKISFFDTKTLNQARSFEIPENPDKMRYSLDGRFLVLRGILKTWVYDSERGVRLAEISSSEVDFSRDGKIVAIGKFGEPNQILFRNVDKLIR